VRIASICVVLGKWHLSTPYQTSGYGNSAKLILVKEPAVTENKSAWHLMDSAPDEVSREQPAILLVHSINVSPDPDSPFWLPVIGYGTKRDGWKAVVNDAGLVPIYWTEIPTPLPPKGLPPV
jgi:hypothetical protein